jgi:hypothetical protein
MTRTMGVLNPAHIGRRSIPGVEGDDYHWRQRCKTDSTARAVQNEIARDEVAHKRCELANILMGVIYQDICVATAEEEASGHARAIRKSDWLQYKRYCDEHDLAGLLDAPEAVSHWLLAEAVNNPRPAGLRRMLNSIAWTLRWMNKPFDPGDTLVKATMAFIDRCWAEEQSMRGEPDLPVRRDQHPNANGSGQPH